MNKLYESVLYGKITYGETHVMIEYKCVADCMMISCYEATRSTRARLTQ